MLLSNMTASKETRLREVFYAYRKGAVLLCREQWRLFFETGKFNEFYDVNKVTFAAVIGRADRVQMARGDVVGQLRSWISNRANDFRDAVNGCAFAEAVKNGTAAELRHMLLTINRRQAWFLREDVVMAHTGEIIPKAVRELARSIMRGVMRRCRRPDVSRTSMRLDRRVVEITEAAHATQGGKVDSWLTMKTMPKQKPISVPLLANKHHASRKGEQKATILVIENRETKEIRFGVVTDIGHECDHWKADYKAEIDVLPLDFGLKTMFATDDGCLLGRNWLDELKRYDKRIQDITKGWTRRGNKKLRENKRYRDAVQDMRGFVKTEVNRVLNALVAQKKPARLLLERLDFRNPDLSRQLNRIIQNCGRSVIKQKLADLESRLGVKSEEVNPAYTSQGCSKCGYVDKRNRKAQDTFKCLWCGKKIHADVNGARNVGGRRATSFGSVFQSKAKILVELVNRFNARWAGVTRPGGCGSTADPRLTNPYFCRGPAVPQMLNKSEQAIPA